MMDRNESQDAPIPFEDKIKFNTKLPPLGASGPREAGISPAPASTVVPSSQIHTFESESKLGRPDTMQFKRPLTTGTGATRMKTFHTKLADAAMKYLEDQINEWLDASPDILVKFCTTTVGVVEGKRAEPHLIITVWY